MSGWIKLHRGLTEWEWYTDANTMRVFIHCLLKANHTDKKWRGHDIKRGQFIGSYDSVAKDLNLTVSKVRTSLNKLKLTGEMTIKGGNQHTVFTIENYDSYQSLADESQTDDKRMTIKSQTDDNQIAATKNLKNLENEKNDKNTVEIAFDIFYSAGLVKKSKQAALKSFTSICKNGKKTPEEIANTLAEDIKKRITAKQFGIDQLHPSTYLNGRRWEDEITVSNKTEMKHTFDVNDYEEDM